MAEVFARSAHVERHTLLDEELGDRPPPEHPSSSFVSRGGRCVSPSWPCGRPPPKCPPTPASVGLRSSPSPPHLAPSRRWTAKRAGNLGGLRTCSGDQSGDSEERVDFHAETMQKLPMARAQSVWATSLFCGSGVSESDVAVMWTPPKLLHVSFVFVRIRTP